MSANPTTMPDRRHALLILLLLAVAAAASLAASLAIGSLPLSAADLWRILCGDEAGVAGEVVRTLRLPRALAGLACGGLLALSGALMQLLLKNPLADPYVLGVSGGAAVGTLLAMLLGLPLLMLHGGAFAGALAAMLLVFGLAHGDGSWTQTRLLLTGVVVASGCGAGVALILSIAPESALRGMLFWLMGDLSQADSPWPALAVLLLGMLVAGALGLRYALRVESFRERFDAAWLKLPLVGRLARGYNAARFAATLAMLAAAGVPILKALQAAAQTLNNRAMRADALDALVLVREGAPLASALNQKKRFPGLLSMFARLGEQTGQLPTMLQRAAAQLSVEVQRRAMQLATILEPLLIVVMGLVVMMIVLAVLLPIIQLNQLVK